MSIRFQVLGKAGRDNAVFVEVDSGQSVCRFLFDCGYGCTDSLSVAQLQALNGLFISHFHMDHVSGFDSVLRFNFGRPDGPFLIVGPQDTCRAIHHRLRGYTWNLVSENQGSVEVREFGSGVLRRMVFPTQMQFEQTSLDESVSSNGIVYQDADSTVSMIELDHGCVSAGYLVREANRENIDSERLTELGFQPGAWLKQVKDGERADDELIEVGGQSLSLGRLRELLMTRCPGESIAYLTDFRATGMQLEQLVDFVRNVDVVVCENNYCNADAELAIKNYHLTSGEVGQIAASAGAKKLVLFHLSDRYRPDQWQMQLEEVRNVFPETYWPNDWNGF